MAWELGEIVTEYKLAAVAQVLEETTGILLFR